MGTKKPLIVILEDDHSSAEALRLIVEDWGGETVLAVSAAGVRQLLGARVREIEYVLADFNLGPTGNGVNAAESLRSEARGARILILTGSFRGRANILAAAAGLPVMTKPASADAILDWLSQPR